MDTVIIPITSHCIFCGCLLNDKVEKIYASSINDGGTIVCGRCNGWFHPDRGIIAAHKYNGHGPLSCEICKGK